MKEVDRIELFSLLSPPSIGHAFLILHSTFSIEDMGLSFCGSTASIPVIVIAPPWLLPLQSPAAAAAVVRAAALRLPYPRRTSRPTSG